MAVTRRGPTSWCVALNDSSVEVVARKLGDGGFLLQVGGRGGWLGGLSGRLRVRRLHPAGWVCVCGRRGKEPVTAVRCEASAGNDAHTHTHTPSLLVWSGGW